MPKKQQGDQPEDPSSTPYAPALSASESSAEAPPGVPSVDVPSQSPVTPPPFTPPTAPPVMPPPIAPPSTPQVAPPPYGASASYAYQVGTQKPPTILSLLAMIFGIAGAVLACCYGGGFLFAVAGIVLGHLGRKREAAQGMALTGLITGYVGAALSLIIWVLLIVVAFSPLLMIPFLSSDWS